MKKYIVNIPAEISLIPYKKPCLNVNFNDDFNISWDSEKKEKVKDLELEEFLKDTKNLVENFGIRMAYQYFLKILETNQHDMNMGLKIINDYFNKWGCPIYTKCKSINFLHLLYSTFSVFVFIDFWNNTDKWLNNFKRFFTNEINVLIEDFNLGKGKRGSWVLSPHNHGNSDTMLYHESMIQNEFGYFRLRFKFPSKGNMKVLLQDDKALIEYIRENLLASLSVYIKKRLEASIKLNGTVLEFGLKSNDNLLLYLLFNLPDFLKDSIRFCDCGCKNIVLGKGNYLPGHIEKKRNTQFDRKLKARIRMMKNRNKITETLYKDLCNKIDSLVNQRISNNQIEEIINNEIAKED